MAKNRAKLVKLLGAKIVGELADVGSGVFGMAHTSRILNERLTPGKGKRPGMPTNPRKTKRPKAP